LQKYLLRPYRTPETFETLQGIYKQATARQRWTR
jgi:hypothetical protein